MENKQELGKIRSIIFPIYKNELRKFLPLVTVFLLISLNYTLLRSLKDIFILSNAGAIVLSYLKLVGVIPSIILLTIAYSKISKVTSRDGRFNIVIGYFLCFLILTYFFLLPHLSTLQLDKLADQLHIQFPRLSGMWEAIRYWPLSIFYIHAEAWGTLVLSVLLWTFINEITSAKQAKRFYSFLALGGAIGATSAGMLLQFSNSNFDMLLGLLITSTALSLVVYNIFALDIKKNAAFYQVEQKPKKKKMKLSLVASFKFLMQSRYLALISVLVLSYNLSINLFESVWKDRLRALKEVAGNTSILTAIYGYQATLVGVISCVLIIFVSSHIMNKGWRFAASVTPFIAFILTLIFFTFIYFNDSLSHLATLLGTDILSMTVLFGMLNVVSIKAFKYMLFDPTKEAAYIPLDEESKVRGKAAVDGLGSRVGKGLGSIIIALLSNIFGGVGVGDIKYILFFVILATIIAWLSAIKRLSILKHEEEERLESKSVSANHS